MLPVHIITKLTAITSAPTVIFFQKKFLQRMQVHSPPYEIFHKKNFNNKFLLIQLLHCKRQNSLEKKTSIDTTICISSIFAYEL